MIRRQQFVTTSYYEHMLAGLAEMLEYRRANPLPGDTVAESASRSSREMKQTLFIRLMLRYTAGEDVESIGSDLELLIEAYELCQKDLAAYEGVPEIAPLNIEDWAYQYQEFVQVVGFCILLHRHDCLARFVGLFDAAGFAGEDVLYEDLINKVLPGRREVDEYYHDVYQPLVDAIYADVPEERSRLLSEYCSGWYAAFGNIPNYWHDTHLSMTEEGGSYFGYWVIEAAAVAYLYNIDDSEISHMVYPRDLVEYARSYHPGKSEGHVPSTVCSVKSPLMEK